MFEELRRSALEAAIIALEGEGESIAEIARARAPRESGALAEEIFATGAERTGEGEYTVRIISPDPHGRASDPNARDPDRYNVPAFQEFGARHHDAQPYMRPALEERRADIANNIAKAVKRATKKARVERRKLKVTLKAIEGA